MGLLIVLGSCLIELRNAAYRLKKLAFNVISATAFLSACLNLPIRPVCSERDIPDVVTGCDAPARLIG